MKPEVRGAPAKRAGRWTGALLVITVLILGGGSSVFGQNALAAQAKASVVAPRSSWRFAIYGQATYIEQESDRFHAPYNGPSSLTPDIGRETTDATLYLGARLWQGAEFWVNPEADQGFGLADTLGLAGFSSGEAYKVGQKAPYFRLQRAFIRETFNFSGESTASEAGPNQFDLAQSANRLVVTVGKLSVVDIFDVKRYAHDPRADFLNWSVIDAGSFDYAADAWGYTVGGAAEWYVGPWTWRTGVFDLSDVPNSARLEPAFHEYQVDFEVEHRQKLFGKPGKLNIIAFESRGHGAPAGRHRLRAESRARRRALAGAALPQARWNCAESGATAHTQPRDVRARG